MEKKKKIHNIRYCQIAVLFGLLFFIACGLSNTDNKKKEKTLIGDLEIPQKEHEEEDSINCKPFNGNYYRTFNDLHDLHMEEASKYGFAPMATRGDTSRMKGKIVYYKPGVYENFVVDSLPHSMPVMIPPVAKLIENIAVNFRDSLRNKNRPDHKIIVTSITRTDEDIKHLRRRNRNAISESAHRFGTTFDITWLRYHKVDSLDTRIAYDRILKKALGEVLHDLQQQKKCYVKYEQHQMCFHITIRQ